MMFDRFVAARNEKRGKAWALVYSTSVLAHAGALAALVFWSFWKIEKVQAKTVPVTFIEERPLPPAEEPAKPPLRLTPSGRSHGTKRPSRPSISSDPTPGRTEPGEPTGTDTSPTGDPSGPGVPDGTGPATDGPPVGPPPPPQQVPESIIGASRIAGVREIPLAPAAKQALVAQGRRTTTAAVKLCLDSAGVPSRIEIVRSTGFPDADEQIKSAMAEWRYRPYRVNGQAIPVCTAVVFSYQIE